jgi:hypothetical protein
MARRLLLLGLRLHDAQLVDFMLQDWIKKDSPHYDDTLSTIHQTAWLHHGARRSLLDASCAGWVSHSGLGCEYSARIWLACRHGASWRQAMYASVSQLLRHCPQITEKNIDESITWTIRESFYDAFVALLHCKSELSQGRQPCLSLRTDLSQLQWTLGAFNVTPM